ncbi:putative cell surface protein have conserved domain [Bacteroides sp. CAG:530]|nr:putative cell surface protein have conserved domain [Bacteroides sp. CAG:530]
MTIIKYIKFVVIIVIVTIVFSCSKNEAGNSEYDPSLPISLTDFFPIQGGMATRMVIEGANFGTDISQIKVFFNQKEASILNVKNSIIYLLVPKLPGNDCIVTVKVGNQEARFTRNFQYIRCFC